MTFKPETDGNSGIVSKVPIPRQLVSVSVSIQGFLESRYQYRYRSRGLSIFCKVLAEFLLSKVSVSVSVPVHFHGISISIGLDVDQVWVSVSVSVSVQGHKKYQYQYRLEISGPVCLWYRMDQKPALYLCTRKLGLLGSGTPFCQTREFCLQQYSTLQCTCMKCSCHLLP